MDSQEILKKVEDAVSKTKLKTSSPDEEKKEQTAFERRLAETGVTREHLEQIAIEILDTGIYTETITLFGKLKVVFGTRLNEDSQRLIDVLETRSASWKMTQDFVIQNYNLAASLLQYGKDKIPHKPGDDNVFLGALTYIQRLPEPIVHILHTRLSQFDIKVRLAMEPELLGNL